MSARGDSLETEGAGGWEEGGWVLMGAGFLLGGVTIFWNYVVVLTAHLMDLQPCKYTSSTDWGT